MTLNEWYTSKLADTYEVVKMTLDIQTKQGANEAGDYTAYYLNGDYVLDRNEIFLGVARESQCAALRGKSHVTFNKYRNCIEIPDAIFPTEKILKAFQFYAEYVSRMAKEHEEDIINAG